MPFRSEGFLTDTREKLIFLEQFRSWKGQTYVVWAWSFMGLFCHGLGVHIL